MALAINDTWILKPYKSSLLLPSDDKNSKRRPFEWISSQSASLLCFGQFIYIIFWLGKRARRAIPLRWMDLKRKSGWPNSTVPPSSSSSIPLPPSEKRRRDAKTPVSRRECGAQGGHSLTQFYPRNNQRRLFTGQRIECESWVDQQATNLWLSRVEIQRANWSLHNCRSFGGFHKCLSIKLLISGQWQLIVRWILGAFRWEFLVKNDIS